MSLLDYFKVEKGLQVGEVVIDASAGSITADTINTATGFSGDLTGDVTGNLTGDVTGNLTGDVTGNVT